MKHLEIKSKEFIELRDGFGEYLKALGYADTTAYNLPNALNEVFYNLEQKGVSSVLKIAKDDLDDFWDELQQRPNERRGGGLSINYLKKYDQAMKAFNNYLMTSKGISLSYHFDLTANEELRNIVFLTQEEVSMLYEAIEDGIMGSRDRAMLAVYYGCRLRRNEGECLDVRDVQFDSNRILVRHGKGYKEHLVPMANRVVEEVREYILVSRPKLLKDRLETALFINERGKRLSGQMMYKRLKCLVEKTSITKKVGLHTLRHSIATQLLYNGMSLEKISKFLGHSSIESTQIYTHLIK